MGVTKTTGYDTEIVQQAKWIKALGHPARICIILHLLEHQSCIQEDLIEILPLGKSTVRDHMLNLMKGDLIQVEQTENTVLLKLNKGRLKDVRSFIKALCIIGKI